MTFLSKNTLKINILKTEQTTKTFIAEKENRTMNNVKSTR
jgi:hypothetical protein